MKLEDFKKLIQTLKEADTQIDDAYKAKIDLIDFVDVYHGVITLLLKEIYGEEGEDYLSWWLYENDFGRGGLEAYDEDGKQILRTEEELWEFLEEKRKIKNNLKLRGIL